MSTSFNPFQPPETRDQPRPAKFAQATFSRFLMRGLVCAGLFVLLTGIERLLPELPFQNATAYTGGLLTVLCTGLFFLFCGRLVQGELRGIWFFAWGAGLEFVAVIASFLLIVFVARTLPGSLGSFVFAINMLLNITETVGLTVVFGWLTERHLRFRVFVVAILLSILSTALSSLVMSVSSLLVSLTSVSFLIWMTMSVSASCSFLCTASALWFVNLQPAKVK